MTIKFPVEMKTNQRNETDTNKIEHARVEWEVFKTRSHSRQQWRQTVWHCCFGTVSKPNECCKDPNSFTMLCCTEAQTHSHQENGRKQQQANTLNTSVRFLDYKCAPSCSLLCLPLIIHVHISEQRKEEDTFFVSLLCVKSYSAVN